MEARRAHAFVVLRGIIPLALFACGASGDAAPRYDEDCALERRLSEVVSIGAADDVVGFRDIRGFGIDSRGRLWVAEWDAVFHIFEPDGRHVGSWNRTGGGPAEFGYVTAMAVDPETGRVAVRDTRRTVTIMTEEFEEIARWNVPLVVPGAGAMSGVRFDPWGDGVVLAVGQRRESVEKDDLFVDRTHGSLIRTDARGEVLDSLAALVGPPIHRSEVERFTARTIGLAGRQVWAVAGEFGVLAGDGHSAYELHLLSPAGDPLRSFGRNLHAELLTRYGGPELRRGHLFRVLYDPSRTEILACRVGFPSEPQLIDHFTAQGEYIGTMEWPGCPSLFTPDGMAYGFVRGEFDEWVLKGLRYELSEAAEGGRK